MSEVNKQIQALKKASQDKRNKTLLKVTSVLHVMKEKNIPINFGSVAKLAGISKTWLYNQPELKNQIENLRIKTGKIQRVVDLQSMLAKVEEKNIILKQKNTALREKIKKMRQQLEVVYGELYKIRQSTST